MVDLKFCDLWGRWRHVTLPAPASDPALMESGVGFDGSSLGLTTVKSATWCCPGDRHGLRRPLLGGADPELPLCDAGGGHSGAIPVRSADPGEPC